MHACLCACMCAHPRCGGTDWQTACRSHFSSIVWVSGTKLKLSALVVNALPAGMSQKSLKNVLKTRLWQWLSNRAQSRVPSEGLGVRLRIPQ